MVRSEKSFGDRQRALLEGRRVPGVTKKVVQSCEPVKDCCGIDAVGAQLVLVGGDEVAIEWQCLRVLTPARIDVSEVLVRTDRCRMVTSQRLFYDRHRPPLEGDGFRHISQALPQHSEIVERGCR